MASFTQSFRPVYVPYDYDEGAESIEDYKPGGLHPTHLGDLLGQNGRYKVAHKLGYGGFGTVWLCRDLEQNRWRAVKILAASHSSGQHCADLRVCEMLSNVSPREKDVHVSHVVVPEDHFWHEGPNGNHLCVVMPVLGPNLEDAAEKYQHQEEPLRRICYQLVLAMKFLHERGICHGDLRPSNICYILKGIDDLEEEDFVRVLGRPKLLCYVDDGEYDWHSDFGGDDEEDGPHDEPEDCLDNTEEVESNSDAADDDAQESDNHEPRYIVVTPYLDDSSEYFSDDIAVIDFGESFLVSNAPEATGIPLPYRPPEGFFENCGTFGIGSDIWALGCSIFEIRNTGQPFLDGGLWSFLSHWEDLNGPLPEPYRSSLAKEGAEVPEDPTQWVSLSEDERKERISEHMSRTGVPGSLHNLLLLEQRYTVPLAEGEAQQSPPPPSRSTRGSILARAGRKVVAYEMSQREALQLMDLFKKTFAWKPEDRSTAAEILDHPWFEVCREEEGISSDDDEPDHAIVPFCGILPMLPYFLRALRRMYGF